MRGEEASRFRSAVILVQSSRRPHIQFAHLDLGPCKEQGDISAVLSGENSHCLLSVLDVHTIYLSEEEEKGKKEPSHRG